MLVSTYQASFAEIFVSLISQGPDSKAANELIGIDGVLNAITRNLEKAYGHVFILHCFCALSIIQ